MNKKIFSIILVVFIFISLSVVSASDACNEVVATSSDSVDVQSATVSQSNTVLSDDNVGTFTELNQSVQDGSAITLDKDYKYSGGSDEPKNLLISRAFTIEGNGHTIDGNGIETNWPFIQTGDRALYKLTVNNLVFSNFNSDVLLGSMFLNNVTFVNCTAEKIVRFDSADMTDFAINCKFINNKADYLIYIVDGMDTHNINNNVFLNNTVSKYVVYVGGYTDSFSNNVIINDNNEYLLTDGATSEDNNFIGGLDSITINGPDSIEESSVFSVSLPEKFSEVSEFELLVDVNPKLATLNTTSVILGGGKTAYVNITPKKEGDMTFSVGSGLVCDPIGTKIIQSNASIMDTNLTADTFSEGELNLTIGNSITLNATLLDSDNNPVSGVNVSFLVDEDSFVNVTDENGIARYSLDNLAIGEYNINYIFNGTDSYAPSELNVNNTLRITKIDTSIELSNETFDLKVNDNISSGASLTPADAGTLSFSSSNESVVKVEDGNIIAVGEGVADITVSFDGDANYTAAENKTITVNVTKTSTSISVNNDTFDLTVGSNDTIVASVVPSDAGELDYTSSDVSVVTVNGIGEMTAVGTGSANITVSFFGNDAYSAAENKTILVTVKEIPEVNITSDDITVGDNLTVDAVLPENATGNVTATVDNETYSAEIINGSASLIIPDLAVGNHTIPITYTGDSTFAPVTKEINVTVNDKPDIIITATTDIYRGGKLFINVTDKNGTPLANKTVVMTINGQNYTRTTNENGSCNITIKLVPGDYDIPVSVDNITANITVNVKSTIVSEDIEKYFRNATQFYATLLDSEGNRLANSTANFNINGVPYTRKTNENGTAKLNINLNPGEYIITTTNPVTGDQKGNNVTVLSTIIGKDIVKYFRNGTQYTATFLDSEGNILTNGTATFNINGVFYDRKINENGTAKLNINLVPGNYTITAINPINNQTISNNIEVLSNIITSDITVYTNNRTPFVAHIINGSGNSIFEDIEADLSNIADVLSNFNVTDISELNTTDSLGLISKISNITSSIKQIADANNITALNLIFDNIQNHTGNFTDIINAIENGTFADLVNEAAAKLNVTLENLTQVLMNVTDVNGTEINMNETLAKLSNFTDFLSTFKVSNITDFNATKSLEFITDLLNLTSTIDDMIPSFSNSSSELISPILENINVSSLNLSDSIKSIDGDALVSLINNVTGKLNISLDDLINSIGSYGSPESPLVNATVTFNVNGVMYSRKTNATGDAKLNINLPVGDYIITTSCNDLSISNKIRVRDP